MARCLSTLYTFLTSRAWRHFLVRFCSALSHVTRFLAPRPGNCDTQVCKPSRPQSRPEPTMSHSVLRSTGSARFFRRLKPATKKGSVPERWPEGQLYPVCNPPNATAHPKQAVRERHLKE